MSSTPSIPHSLPLDKDPPAPSPSPSLSHLRNPSLTMPPPPRPLLTTTIPSFEPQPHLLAPSPLLPAPLPTDSTSASTSWQQPASTSPTSNNTPFAPFFTLINDFTRQSTHHPSKIHYIFSDDDVNDFLTSSLLASDQSNSQQQQKQSPSQSRESLSHTSASSSSATTFKKNLPQPSTANTIANKPTIKREERVIIVDINATMDGVENISSLSKEWQVLNAQIERAPSFDPSTSTEGDDAEGGGRGLMLRIEGVGVESFRDGKEEGGKGDVKGLGIRDSGSGSGMVLGMSEEEMQGLLEGFDRKMGVLRGVVGFGSGIGGEGGVGGGVKEGEVEREGV